LPSTFANQAPLPKFETLAKVSEQTIEKRAK